MVEVIWPLSVAPCRVESNNAFKKVLPLRMFIQETLRRSRTSYSTLQVALYYLILIKPHVPKCDFTTEQSVDSDAARALQCGRRMFLAALILASKYLQDRNYSARAWSKISGLKIYEINTNEIAFLLAVNWKLHIPERVFEQWTDIVLKYTPFSQHPSSPGGIVRSQWKEIVPLLTPELELVNSFSQNSWSYNKMSSSQSQELILDSSPLVGKPASASQETTPTCRNMLRDNLTPRPTSQSRPPPFLEPRLDMMSMTPQLPRLGTLPTPQMTPTSTCSSTPAASAGSMGFRRPSMCAVMAQAQNSSLIRAAFDQWAPSSKFTGLEQYQFSNRRPSIAASSSTNSSPESRVSESSSRCSRASSISTVSSIPAQAPGSAALAKLATCRNVGLQRPALSRESSFNHELSAREIELAHVLQSLNRGASPPDLSDFSLDEAKKSDATNGPADDAAANRKRQRSSVDLQHHVRGLLRNQALHSYNDIPTDPNVASTSFAHTPSSSRMTLSGVKAMQSTYRHLSTSGRLPVQNELGSKRACCATEARNSSTPARRGRTPSLSAPRGLFGEITDAPVMGGI
ncbi:hypothetical protein LTR04_005237 [Oleoguttula sp. CCFEE 6159]|nr:hypothetical protein LTR04_005237 [Oleoguttula sp. CCFEE 6159]